MTQINSSTNASYALQWQYLEVIQQQDNVFAQPSASDAAFGLDTQADSTAGTPSSGTLPQLPFSLGAMSAMIDAQETSTNGLSPHQADVFGELDADGDGSVSKAEVETAFGADNEDIADYVVGRLDTDGDDNISQSEFAAGTTRSPHGHHHPDMDAQSAQGGTDPLSQLLSAKDASAQTESNADGTTTTTVTYADGSKVSTTSAPAATGDASSSQDTTQRPLQANLLEQLIKMQAQLTQLSSASPSASVTA